MIVADKSTEANETFFAEGLAKLRAGEMEESTGKLLMDLIEIRADKALLPFARKWIKLFPRVESAPRLVGKWLQNYESNDATYLATSYVKTYPDVNALILIVRAVAQLPKIPPKLLDAVEKRFASDPNSHVWSRLQAPENPKEELNVLILRWLEINRYDPKHAVEVSWIALFSQANDVLNEILRWIEVNQDKTQDIWIVFVNMLRGKSESHKLLQERVATTASQWLRRNPDYRNAGRIYHDVVLALRNSAELQQAKNWYLNHSESESAYMALAGILRAAHLTGDALEPEFVSHAKRILASQLPQDRAPVLVESLLLVSDDPESIGLAKEILHHHPPHPWLLVALLRVSPDDELISKASERLKKFDDGSPELIIEMLKIDPKNEIAKTAAKRWLKKYPDNEQSKTVQSLLSES